MFTRAAAAPREARLLGGIRTRVSVAKGHVPNKINANLVEPGAGVEPACSGLCDLCMYPLGLYGCP
jgi:hypothetical protein